MYEISELTGNIYFNGVVVPQDDTNAMWQAYWLHKQDGGEIIFVEATPEEIVEQENQQKQELKRQAHDELLPTDWYVVRFIEKGIPIPEDILKQRQEIRDKYN